MTAFLSNTNSVTLSLIDFGLAEGRRRARRPRAAPRLVSEPQPEAERRALETVELSLEQLDAAQAEWAELAARAIEPNAFFEPGFALAAARHFPLRSRPRFIVVWDGGVSGAKRMRGLFPIVTSSPLIGDGLIRLWLHKQTALATPLVDREDPQAVIAAFLDWIERRSFSNGVVFSRTAMNGPFQKALAAAARDRGRRVETLDSYERAALLRGHEADELCLRASSGKSLRRLYRMRRRLSKLGKVDFTISVEADEIRVATEEFLVLEASGWKAGRGALLSEAALSTFLRSSTRMLARERLCKIYALRLDGRPVAMGIVIESQGRSFWWKIAYDERFGAHMPGMQLAHEITKAQLARPEIELTDSCSQANHPMIERIWPDRLTVCDYAVQLQRDREIEFLKSCRISRRRASLRGLAKRATIALLRRKAR